jgi:tripartite-type tricarboxylate transporter receptor subunit TctC
VSAGIAEAIKSPEVAQRLAGEVSTAVGNTPEQFSAHIHAEAGKCRKVLMETGLIIQLA